MKRCPQCNLGYTDESIEFCLEDGTRLEVYNEASDEPPTVFSNKSTLGGRSAATQTQTAQTFPNGASKFASTWDTRLGASGQQNLQEQNENLPQTGNQSVMDETTAKILIFAPIVAALCQNYWQWLYMSGNNSFKFPDFLWATNFYVWLGLLVAGTVLSVVALRKNVDKKLAVISLVILAINFLLCIVPRR